MRPAAGWIDAGAGTIDAAIYWDPAVYALEQERVFGKTWLCVAHESLVPKAGDFFTSRMGEDPVIVARQRDGSIAVFLNQCRHRGARLCRADMGQAKVFACSYHGWTYDLAGNLISISKESVVDGGKIDKTRWGAVKVAKIHNYHGLIFATWNPDAPAFDDFLGEAKWYFDMMFDRPGGTEVIGGVQKWVVKANWKLGAEQFTSDIYHFDYTHVGTSMAFMPPDMPMGEPPVVNGRQFRDQGHGGVVTTDVQLSDMQTAIAMGMDVLAYNQSRRPLMAETLGALRGHDAQPVHANIFPNLGILPLNQTLRLWQPRGPGEMEVWAWTLVDKEAPPEIKERARLQTQFTFASSGVFEQDDAENWAEVQRALRGPMGRSAVFNNQIGRGESRDPDGIFPGTTDFAMSEAAARGFYAHWQKLMLEDGQ
ncbi:MAG: aromatic ring-hydroxylating dioxygenase subunit alpha [Sphingobium sp.]|uniref:aromatic ring-hydroxylating oxygenase subunit alpha n=1 Tax=Sphingobium sp. TaxID=1912891 RepID=UPI002E2009E2